MAFILFLVTSVLVVQSSAAPIKWIDLTYQMAENETVYWTGQPFWKHSLIHSGPIGPSNVYVSYGQYSAGEHGGTHIDAPNHFIKGGLSLEKVSIENLNGPGIVVNVSAKVDKNSLAELELSDLMEWEKKHGRIPDNAVVFMYSGMSKYWPDRKKYFNTETPDNSSTIKTPGLHRDAAKWLLDNRKMKLFGLDAYSFDQSNDTEFRTHKILLGAGVPGIENVAYLEKLPARGFEVFAFPLKIKGGTGGPIRIFARIDPSTNVNSAPVSTRVSLAVIIMAIATTMMQLAE